MGVRDVAPNARQSRTTAESVRASPGVSRRVRAHWGAFGGPSVNADRPPFFLSDGTRFRCPERVPGNDIDKIGE
jgi:hypothetical protein